MWYGIVLTQNGYHSRTEYKSLNQSWSDSPIDIERIPRHPGNQKLGPSTERKSASMGRCYIVAIYSRTRMNCIQTRRTRKLWHLGRCSYKATVAPCAVHTQTRVELHAQRLNVKVQFFCWSHKVWYGMVDCLTVTVRHGAHAQRAPMSASKLTALANTKN